MSPEQTRSAALAAMQELIGPNAQAGGAPQAPAGGLNQMAQVLGGGQPGAAPAPQQALPGSAGVAAPPPPSPAPAEQGQVGQNIPTEGVVAYMKQNNIPLTDGGIMEAIQAVMGQNFDPNAAEASVYGPNQGQPSPQVGPPQR